MSNKRRVSIQEPSSGGENSSLLRSDSDAAGDEMFNLMKQESRHENSNRRKEEMLKADRLSMRLLEVPDDDSDEEFEILRQSLDLSAEPGKGRRQGRTMLDNMHTAARQAAMERFCTMIGLSVLVFAAIAVALYVGVEFIGPPNQPIGPYFLTEKMEGDSFFGFYNFYDGPDSVGSNGFNTYVSLGRATEIGIVNVTMEKDVLDVYYETDNVKSGKHEEEPFLYISSAPTKSGKRESIRLEGKQRYNRGLFIIDVRHMPAGCGVWPAFWLTDEANWPVNGEIDIVEGVNYQSMAKTALHTTKGCSMEDVPVGVKKGGWDSAVGIPDKKTGIPDMTQRDATNCFVYDPHQWLNQGCVAVDTNGGSLGRPLNEKGGGVFVLEWDPVYRHIRTWVFTPHLEVPENLAQAIRTAKEPVIENRVMPDPELWPLPYGYFPIGDGTTCPSSHFRNMRLVLNTAFCGSVCGNRFQLDCPNQSKTFETCNDWIKSEPKELEEAYWKIRGVYVYQRKWEKGWVSK